MKIKRQMSLLIALLFLTAVITGCSGETKVSDSSNSSTAAVNEIPQEIGISIGGEPSILDPQLISDVTPMNVINTLFEGLYRKDKNGTPMPGIAESFETGEGGLKYTFKLRDAVWNDGTPVTSEDFKTAWLRALDPKPQDHEPARMAALLYYIKGAEQYNMGEGKREDVAIDTPDSKTLAVTLVKPTPFFLDLVCNSVYMPLNKVFYDKQPVENKVTKYGANAENVLANGPFKIQEWNRGQNIVLVKNDKYWNAKDIKLKKVTFKIFKDASAAFMAFRSGETDIAEVTTEAQRTESAGLGFKVESYNTGATSYIGFNTKDPLLKNVNIRKAMAYAIDRESIVKKVLRDDSLKALGFVNPLIYGNGDYFRKQSGELFKDNNIDEAKSLLEKGLKELNLKSAPKVSLISEDMETAKRDAVAYQDMWKKNLGLEVEVSFMQWDAVLEKMMGNAHQAVLLNWSADYNDPLAFLDVFDSNNQFNIYGYNNPSYDELLSKSKAEGDKAKRNDMLIEAEKLVIDEMIISPVYFARNSYVTNSGIKDLVRNGSSIQNLDLYWTYKDK